MQNFQFWIRRYNFHLIIILLKNAMLMQKCKRLLNNYKLLYLKCEQKKKVFKKFSIEKKFFS